MWLRIKDLNLIDTIPNLDLEITFENGETIYQVWEINPTTIVSYNALYSVLRACSDVDAVIHYLNTNHVQISGKALIEAYSGVANEGFIGDMFKKIFSKKPKFKGGKFGDFSPKQYDSFLKALEANINKTILNDKWLDDNYDPNGEYKLKPIEVVNANVLNSDNLVKSITETLDLHEKLLNKLDVDMNKIYKKGVSVSDRLKKTKTDHELGILVKEMTACNTQGSVIDNYYSDLESKIKKSEELVINFPTKDSLKEIAKQYIRYYKLEEKLESLQKYFLASEHNAEYSVDDGRYAYDLYNEVFYFEHLKTELSTAPDLYSLLADITNKGFKK